MPDRPFTGMHALWSAPAATLGTFVFLRDAASTEIALAAGHDFTILDLEHTAIDLHDAAGHQRAADACGAPMLARLPGFDAPLLGRLLDIGVAGAMLPHFGAERDDALRFVSALRYPPAGTRPACSGVRAAGYGLGSFGDYAAAADRSLVAIGIVEDIAVVDDIDALLKAAPVDAVMPGPGDLSTSMGLPGQPTHPRVQEAVAHIAAAAQRAGVRVGFYLNSPDESALWQRHSPSFYVHLFDTKVLAFAQRTAVQSVRRALASQGAA
jgi:2-keto-3-deoxy-L-rhamnonate aldolase RhmA